MKILHVVPTYLPARRYGGPIVAVHGLCRALVRRGHDVTVFTTNVDGDGESDVPIEQDVLLDGVRVRYFRSSFPRLYVSGGMRKALRGIDAFDVVHNHSVFLWPTAAAARAATRAHVPYVITPRGMLVRELIARKSALVKRSWIRLVERRNFAHAAAIHFTSRRELEDSREIALPLPNPVVIPNGIDAPPCPVVQRDPHLVLYLGRINWKKNLDRLIAAMEHVPNARLIIAGNDEEGLTPKLRALAKDNVEFAGPVYDDAKWNLLARASVLVLPSLSENFGNVILEALAMETPVVVSPNVGLADDVAAAHAGIVSDDLAPAIAAILAGRDATMGRNGRALVESRFTWDAVAAQMEEAYRCSTASRR
ncbi:MAG TPA: glycosyltransferase [Thermoanaerobaculia bacterium]|nr:glycosyltransferase [Thermoanaerobaculia bacterium]